MWERRWGVFFLDIVFKYSYCLYQSYPLCSRERTMHFMILLICGLLENVENAKVSEGSNL